jgi:hypothetical protein
LKTCSKSFFNAFNLTVGFLIALISSPIGAQESGEISALGYVNGEIGTEYCPGDLLSVKAVVNVNNTADEQLSFLLRISFAGEGEAQVDETTLDPGDPGELRGEHSSTAPDAESTSAEVSVYWLDRSGKNEPVLRLLKRKMIAFTKRKDCGPLQERPQCAVSCL